MKVAVLMGGVSSEREVSLVSGCDVARALREGGHRVLVLDTRDGLRDLDGRPPVIGGPPARPAGSAEGKSKSYALGSGLLQALASKELDGVDVAFIALHGGAGEDGTVQAFLQALGLAYTGSGVLGSALSMHKGVAKTILREGGVRTPHWATLGPTDLDGPEDVARVVAEVGGFPVVVKPAGEGSSVGVAIVHSAEELAGAISRARAFSPEILLERYVPGREITVGILGGEALPVVEIIPSGGFYDFGCKYTGGMSRYDVPAAVAPEAAAEAQAQALQAFRLLHADGFGRVDFRLSPEGQFFCLELNTIPGLTPTSLLPKAAAAAGIGYGDLVEIIARLGVETVRAR